MKTFKQFLFEEEQKIYAKLWDAESIKSLSKLNGNNTESAAMVGKVIFDQVNGLGATPNNQNIMYRGFVGMMKPNDFLSFAASADRSEDAASITKLIEQGYGIGSPFLILDIERDKSEKITGMKIKGHEGRARCVALTKLQPSIDIPVHFLLYGETRARHVDKQMISLLNTSIRAEKTESVVANKINSIWLNGKHISL